MNPLTYPNKLSLIKIIYNYFFKKLNFFKNYFYILIRYNLKNKNMQVFIVGSIYDTVIALDKRRKHKQWVEIQQIIDAIDGKKAWKNHPCTIQYKEYKYWLILYRTVIEFINMDMHSSAKNISQIAEKFKPEWHCAEYFDQMKRRLYTKDNNHYKQWADLGESDENWYYVNNIWCIYKNGKRI